MDEFFISFIDTQNLVNRKLQNAESDFYKELFISCRSAKKQLKYKITLTK